MALNNPSASELLESVQQFLADDVVDQVDKRTAFQLRIAQNILSIVIRELQTGQQLDEMAIEEMNQLLNTVPNVKTPDTATDITQLNEALCQCIQDGELSLEDSKLLPALLKITQRKVEINNPRYSALKQSKP